MRLWGRSKGKKYRRCLGIFLSCLSVFLLLAGGQRVSGQSLQIVDAARICAFLDDGDRRSLLQASRHQAAYLRRIPAKKQIKLADRTFSAAWLLTSIEYFIDILERESEPRNIAKILSDNYLVFQIAGRENVASHRQMLVTGYFELNAEGSLRPGRPFLYPIYRPPHDLVCRKAGRATITGRLKGDSLVPYWTRAEIEMQNLLAGSELVYLNDPLEAFLLQVQGSGKIRLRDGSYRTVRYAASNGQPYRSIGKLLIDEGRLTREQATLPEIEKYLRQHPEEMQRILHYNPRFIFFDWGKDAPLQGSNKIPLTAWRSVAVDQEIIAPGTIAFLRTQRPLFDDRGELKGWRPLARFVFPQDSGAAIQGPGRVDLFLGDGHDARLTAGLMREKGTMYILVKKRPRDNSPRKAPREQRQ
jgi:membrane-bound lytic murein transglycosylase A